MQRKCWRQHDQNRFRFRIAEQTGSPQNEQTKKSICKGGKKREIRSAAVHSTESGLRGRETIKGKPVTAGTK